MQIDVKKFDNFGMLERDDNILESRSLLKKIKYMNGLASQMKVSCVELTQCVYTIVVSNLFFNLFFICCTNQSVFVYLLRVYEVSCT